MRLILPLLVAALAACGCASSSSRTTASPGRWRPLFDGHSLEGWVQRGGSALYRADKGQIVGTSVPNTPNSFLCTSREYRNFILELEFKVATNLNSGIQIRSQQSGAEREITWAGKQIKIAANRVHGYQVEIDPSARAWTGGIYDESRRGWLNDLKNNEPARKAFKQGAWNQLRVEARGPSIRTFLNGVPAADLQDDLTPAGFIGLQVHGVGARTEPLEVRWRQIRILELP